MSSGRPGGTLAAWADLLPQVVLKELAPEPSGRAFGSADATEVLARGGLVSFAHRAVAEGHPLTLVINDTHRFTDTASFLQAFFALLDAEIPLVRQPRLRVLVAAGSHVSSRDERIDHERIQVGGYRERIEELCWHDAREAVGLASVGSLVLHRWMSERGFYLACGSMEPHYFAGVTGAHKTLTVGVMSLDCLAANHSNAMSAEACALRLGGNPVHEAIAAAVAELESSGASLMGFNQVIVDGRMVAMSAGPPLQALHEALPAVTASCGVSVPESLDLIVAEVREPLDRDFYQADKGIKNTEHAVRDGGVLVVEAACEKGVGIDHFLQFLRDAPTHTAAVAAVAERGYRLGDHKAVRLRALTDLRGVHVGLLSRGVDKESAAALGVSVFDTREEAASWVAALLRRRGGGRSRHAEPGPRGALVSDAGKICLAVGDESGR